MSDEAKTKRQLLAELRELRQRLAETEKNKAASTDPAGLRSRTEDRLKAEQIETDRRKTDDIESLHHELAVHRVELEMQNEELSNSPVQIEEARARLSDLYDFAPVGYLTLNEKGRVLEANLTIARQLGIERAQIVGSPLIVFIAIADRSAFLSHLAGIVEDNESHKSCELRFMKKDGGAFYVLLDSLLVENADGERRVRLSATDITERRKAEEQLRVTLESITDGFFACDADWGFIYVNAAAERLLGVSRTELLGRSHWEVYPLSLGTRLESEYRKVLRAGEVRDFENFYEPWGRWFHLRCYPREGGGISVYFEDITERKQALKALHESEEQFRRLAESSTDFIMRYDREGRHLYVNPACERASGIPAEQFIGRTHRQLGFGVEQSEEWEKRIRRVFDTAEPAHWDFEYESAQGLMCLDWRVVPEFSEDGIVKTVLGVSRDITERVRAERALQEANAALKVLLKQRGGSNRT